MQLVWHVKEPTLPFGKSKERRFRDLVSRPVHINFYSWVNLEGGVNSCMYGMIEAVMYASNLVIAIRPFTVQFFNHLLLDKDQCCTPRKGFKPPVF